MNIADYIEKAKATLLEQDKEFHPYYLTASLYDWLVERGEISTDNPHYKRVEWKPEPNPNAYVLECVHPVVRRYLEGWL